MSSLNMRKYFKYFLAILILLALTKYGIAHDWYPPGCCGGHDCHPVACTELIDKEHGIQWGKFFFSHDQIHPSQDNQCHVCIYGGTLPESDGSPMCVFIQPSS